MSFDFLCNLYYRIILSNTIGVIDTTYHKGRAEGKWIIITYFNIMINPYTKVKEGYFRKSQVTTQPKEKEVKLLTNVMTTQDHLKTL